MIPGGEPEYNGGGERHIKYEDNYAFVREWLNYTEINSIASAHGVSKQMAYRVLHGKTKKHYQFLKAVYEMAVERQQLFYRLNEKMQSI